MSTNRGAGRRTNDCADGCRYLPLYEGSQASLSDMAAKQSATLGRVASLRSGTLSLMKQHFPTQYAAAERQLGHKLGSRGDADELLLAYLDAFVRQAVVGARPALTPPAPAGVDELRKALDLVGIDVGQGDDLTSWAAVVAAAPPVRAVETTRPAAGVAPDVPNELADIFSPAPDADYGWDPHHDPGMPVDNYDSVFPDSAEVGVDPMLNLENLFDEGPSSAAVGDDVDPEDLINQLYESAPVAPAEPAPAPSPAAPAAELAVATPEPAPSRKAEVARTQSSVVRPEMFPAAQVPRAPRGGSKRGPAKVPRVVAAAPGVEQAAEVADDGPEIATERFAELEALVASPKPVFISDLVAASGSPGLVTAWESHFQDMGAAASPVRVIQPRSHHRARGSLVVPHSAKLRSALLEHGPNVWAECLDDGPDRPRLRGARLYETGVLLHRLADEIISHTLTADVLTLRLNSSEGLRGVVMWVGSDSPATGEGRKALTEAVGSIIGDRLVMLAVLTYESGARAVERLAGVVAEAAEENNWKRTMPVVASSSWDFALDSGASSLAVL